MIKQSNAQIIKDLYQNMPEEERIYFLNDCLKKEQVNSVVDQNSSVARSTNLRASDMFDQGTTSVRGGFLFTSVAGATKDSFMHYSAVESHHGPS